MTILIVFYSQYGHVWTLAKAVAEGARRVEGAEVVLRRAEELPHVVRHMEQEQGYSYQIYQKLQEVPVCTLDDLREADAVLFGSPTRYGNMAAQLKALIDSTAPLWMKGEMEGKPAGVFTSTASTHGGQETTLVSMMIPLLHLGMLLVGVPYSSPGMIHTAARGGTPYGASTIAGPEGSLQPTPEDLAIAEAQGARVATIAAAIAKK